MASKTTIRAAIIWLLKRSQNTRVSSAASYEGGGTVGIIDVDATLGFNPCERRLMPRESFARKHYAVVRSPDSVAAKSYCGCRNYHIDNHGHGSGQDNSCDCHDHARIGFDLTPFDGPIDHAIPPCREDCQNSSETDHAFPKHFRAPGVAHDPRRTRAGPYFAPPTAELL